jgi:hypothetical protein
MWVRYFSFIKTLFIFPAGTFFFALTARLAGCANYLHCLAQRAIIIAGSVEGVQNCHEQQRAAPRPIIAQRLQVRWMVRKQPLSPLI